MASIMLAAITTIIVKEKILIALFHMYCVPSFFVITKGSCTLHDAISFSDKVCTDNEG